MTTRLVVLAAGLGTRFGGPKQFAAVGPNGECLLEYAFREALAAGIDSITAVIRSTLTVPPEVAQNWPQIEWCSQDRDGTLRGTVHAVASADTRLDEIVVTANGDDLYGPASYRRAIELARAIAANEIDGGSVAFPVSATLPASGEPVTRALLKLDAHGNAAEIQELHDVQITDSTVRCRESTSLALDDLVSMNLWVLSPQLWAQTKSLLGDGELNLPDALSQLIAKVTRIRVVPSEEVWCGLTHPSDVDWVRARLVQQPSPRR